MKHFSEVYFPYKDQIIKETTSMVVEASGSGKGGFFDMFNFFSFFGSSDKPESKMSEQEKARVEARKKMVEAQNQRKKDIAERRDKIAAERIRKAAALRKAQFDQRTRKELAKLDEELAALKRETAMIDARGKTDIPFTKEELTRLTKQSLNPDTNIPDDQVLMNAHMRAVLFDPETGELRSNIVGEDGKINTEAFHKQLAERAKEYPHLKKQLQNGGVLDKDGNVAQIDWSNPGENPTFKSLSEFVSKADADIASTQAKLQTAKDTLESSQRSLDDIKDRIATITEQEEKKKDYNTKLAELKAAKEKFEKAKEADSRSAQDILNEIKGEGFGDLEWAQINDPNSITDDDELKKKAEKIKKKLKSLGIEDEEKFNEFQSTENVDDLPEDIKRKLEEEKSKELEEAVKELRDKAYEISGDDNVLNIESAADMTAALKGDGSISKITSNIEKEIEKCDKAIDEACKTDGDNPMKFLKDEDLRKKKVRELEESVSKAETTVGELETANSPEEMMRIMKEEEETIVQMGELGNSDAYRDLKEKINIASKEEKRAPGEIEQNGKIGYIDPAGKFVERPANLEGDALDEYNNGLNSSLATHPKQEPPKGEESVKVKLDGEELKYYKVDKDGKEVEATEDDYVKQQLDAELRARANKIRDEKLGKVKSVLNKLEVDGEDDEAKAKAMEEAIKQLKPEEKALLQAVASSDNPDEILKSAGIKSEDMDKYKQIIDKSGLKKSSTETKPKDSKNDDEGGETGGNDGEGETKKPKNAGEDKDAKEISPDDIEDGEEIKDKDGKTKYVKKNGKFYMNVEGEEEEVEFDDWLKEVEKNTDFDPADLEDMEDEEDDEDKKSKQDPRKVWKQRTYKRGDKTYKTKSYYNKKGASIDQETFKEKVKNFEKQNESLSSYLLKKMLLG